MKEAGNTYLDYALTMAIADGLLKSAEYVDVLKKRLADVDMEKEYIKIVSSRSSHLNYKDRMRVVAIVEYVRAKEAAGPEVVPDKQGIGRL